MRLPSLQLWPDLKKSLTMKKACVLCIQKVSQFVFEFLICSNLQEYRRDIDQVRQLGHFGTFQQKFINAMLKSPKDPLFAYPNIIILINHHFDSLLFSCGIFFQLGQNLFLCFPLVPRWGWATCNPQQKTLKNIFIKTNFG